MASILLVPDIFFHRWHQADGELWLCLRPFVDKAEFGQWAADPHGTGHRFELPKSPEGSVLCKPPQILRSINLPTSIDLWMRVIRGPNDAAPWVRVARKYGCLTAPDIVETDLKLGTQPNSFAHLFNESVRARYEATAGEERDRLADWLELRLESGKALSGRYGSQFKSLYRNEADPAKPLIPFFQPQGRWTTQFELEDQLSSNLFWFNGLMLPLGSKPVSASIAQITAVDLWLVDSNLDLNALEPPKETDKDKHKVRFKICLPPFCTQPSQPYFSQIRDTYTARLVCRQEDPSTLNLRTLPSLPARTDAKDPVAYFSPALQGYQKSTDSPLKDSWEFVSRMGAQSTEQMGLGSPGGGLLGRRRLIDLVGVEVRSAAKDKEGTMLELTPGIVVTGKIKPYRRFPRITGRGTYLATVMVFEPAGDGADLLEHAETRLGVEGSSALSALFERAVVPGGWKLRLLSHVPLPWDGPRKVYRVLATRPGEVTAADAGPRTCEPQSVTLSLRAPYSPLKTLAGRVPAEDSLVRWLWKPDASITSVDALRDAWRDQFGPWANMPVNALFIAGGASLIAEIDAVFLGDYNFFQANSRTRLEQILGVYAQIPEQTPTNCEPNIDPAQDFEDDLANFNTASALTMQGELLDNRVRFAQRSTANVRGLNRHQVIPFVFEWAHAPNNDKGVDPKNAVTWKEIRHYVKSVMLEQLPSEPFRAQLEHTYCTTAAAVAGDGNLIEFQRGFAFDWSPDMPTAAETLDSDIRLNPKAQPARFLECRYEAGAVLLDFHPRLLDPSKLQDLGDLDSRGLAVRAWRSIAEMLRAKTLALGLDLRLFDMAAQAGPDATGAANFARKGFSGHWREALRKVAYGPLPLPEGERQRLINWCNSLLSTAALPTERFTLRVPVDATREIGNIAHVARARLELKRTSEHAPPAFMRLAPITQQPTLGPAAEGSLWNAWTQVGFGRDSSLATLPQDEQQRLRDAFSSWQESLTKETDSVTPVIPTSTTNVPAQSAAPRHDLQALVAELEGTDWFTPVGSPTSDFPVDAQLTLLPLGFAPCARHPQLGRVSQLVLQRAFAHLNDAMDLAYKEWATNDSTDWPSLLRGIAALASPAAAGEWAGPMPELVQAIVVTLLKPQPDVRSPHVHDNVRKLINACVDSSTPAGQFHLAVRRMLLESPALFADAKALLMSRVDFMPSVSAKRTPPENTLARAQFTRVVRPPPVVRTPQVKGQPATEAQAAVVESIAGWKQMVAAGLAGETGAGMRLAFIETLDDARYDNAFTVRTDGQKLEAFENMVDARAMDPLDPRSAGSWEPLPPIVPGKAENMPDVVDREVRLASRAILEPPELLWSGTSYSLAHALRQAKIGQKGWTVTRLSRGEPPNVGEDIQDGLEIAAFRRLSPHLNPAPYADELLVHFVYRVTGDEEATSAGSTDTFDNDGFFIECRRYKGQPVAVTEEPPPPILDGGTEAVLRRFATTARGTSDAAQLALDHLVNGPSTYAHLRGLIRTEAAKDISVASCVLRPLLVGTPDGNFCVGGGTDDLRHRIRDAYLFRPGTAEPHSTAYLVVGLMLDVWSGWDVTIVQGRNMPFEQWDAGCKSASGRAPAPFDPIFWQSSAQSSRQVTQHINRVQGNSAADWAAPNRTFRIPSAWYGMKISVKTFLDKLLFQDSLSVGDGTNRSVTILRPSISQLAYEVPIALTIYQEQFISGRETPHELRFPFPTVICQPSNIANTLIEFPQEYATFSLDIRWQRPDGSTPLILQRIFARPADS